MDPSIIVRGVRQAIVNGEMFLEYLPTVALADGRCVDAEALVRQRRDGRVVPPLDFVA